MFAYVHGTATPSGCAIRSDDEVFIISVVLRFLAPFDGPTIGAAAVRTRSLTRPTHQVWPTVAGQLALQIQFQAFLCVFHPYGTSCLQHLDK